ncbi:hypothetical protein [Caballeronia sp. BR00000012568055]|uniref:hypothetical protein n=1 Tax=Caballeronia sp. BR00000012568055 TaxID=2918761 RepID=UPI0023F760B8|nr:hypothetical protein [Caballeronia sp. BR00000012568055]
MITEMMMDNASKTRDYRWKKALRKPCACLCAGSYVRYLTDALTLQPEDEPNADFYRRIVESLAEASRDTSGALSKAWHARPIENGSCYTSPFQASACKNRLQENKYRATRVPQYPGLTGRSPDHYISMPRAWP